MDLTFWNQYNPEDKPYVKPVEPLTKEPIPDELRFYSIADYSSDSAESFTDDFVNITAGFFDSFNIKDK